VNIPYIPSDKLGVLRGILSDGVTAKVSPLFKQLLTFWNEKRMVRNGVPLIRRLLSVQKTEKDNHATEDDKKKIKVISIPFFNFLNCFRNNYEFGNACVMILSVLGCSWSRSKSVND
jgi:hypothetical protein